MIAPRKFGCGPMASFKIRRPGQTAGQEEFMKCAYFYIG